MQKHKQKALLEIKENPSTNQCSLFRKLNIKLIERWVCKLKEHAIRNLKLIVKRPKEALNILS